MAEGGVLKGREEGLVYKNSLPSNIHPNPKLTADTATCLRWCKTKEARDRGGRERGREGEREAERQAEIDR